MNSRTVILGSSPKEVNFTLEIGGKALSLYAKELTGNDADAVSEKSLDKESGAFKTGDFYNHRIIASIYDQETKKPLFTDEDFDAVKGIPASVLNKLREKVSEANSDLSLKDVEAKKK